MVEPEEVLAPGSIHFSDIPVDVYQRTLSEESTRYSTEEFLNIWQDICAIREFETVLNEIKIKGRYKGLAYQHAGPAHLSIGQEAAAVGMAFALTPEDHIYGSHRSHGEILAKAFSAIRQLEDRQLLEIMESYRGGVVLRPVAKGYSGNVRSLAMRFLIRRLQRDLCPRNRVESRMGAPCMPCPYRQSHRRQDASCERPHGARFGLSVSPRGS